jgi:type VI secretion system secreted protein Hcp
MAAFMKMGDIEGEATDEGHGKWILLQSMSSPLSRTIPEGAKDQQRTKGHTIAGDVVVVRQLDSSSPKLQEACATGNFYSEVEIHFCTQAKGKQEPYLKYKLSNAIVSGYAFHGVESGNPLPSEEVTLNYTKAEWTYTVVDPKTGDKKGDVVGKFDPGVGGTG